MSFDGFRLLGPFRKFVCPSTAFSSLNLYKGKLYYEQIYLSINLCIPYLMIIIRSCSYSTTQEIVVGVCPVTLICITARSYWQCHQAVGDLLFQVKMLKQKAESCTVKTSAVMYSVFQNRAYYISLWSYQRPQVLHWSF